MHEGIWTDWESWQVLPPRRNKSLVIPAGGVVTHDCGTKTPGRKTRSAHTRRTQCALNRWQCCCKVNTDGPDLLRCCSEMRRQGGQEHGRQIRNQDTLSQHRLPTRGVDLRERRDSWVAEPDTTADTQVGNYRLQVAWQGAVLAKPGWSAVWARGPRLVRACGSLTE